ncbi:hypothetical protein BpHYR1_043815 [Brachionus plicatilis]|uniref:Uncharacterized protein n=1 Tax=Brachionus plicatilis TaxID=10195 RepID=A0A3M7RWP0_BRAPC|nr:hypothetical protein BpHYR1_043815 [Brachionus plicatilis]
MYLIQTFKIGSVNATCCNIQSCINCQCLNIFSVEQNPSVLKLSERVEIISSYRNIHVQLSRINLNGPFLILIALKISDSN